MAYLVRAADACEVLCRWTNNERVLQGSLASSSSSSSSSVKLHSDDDDDNDDDLNDDVMCDAGRKSKSEHAMF